MLFRKHNAIFIHIPKTGGSSIEDMIWPDIDSRSEEDLWKGFVRPFYNKYQTGGLQHLCAHQIRDEVERDFFRDAYKFTMVRNPWDKVISQFVFMQKRDDLRRFIGMEREATLAEYLELILKKEHVQWMEQHRFFLDENGEVMVDDILRFEHFKKDVASVMSRLGITFETFLHRKKGDRRHYSTYYDPQTKEMVQEIYAKDIALLGYEFEAG